MQSKCFLLITFLTKHCSLIAVHGIGAHPLHTWSYWNPDTHAVVNWLKDDDILRQNFSHARIMIFGYRSDWKGQKSSDVTVSDVAKRFCEALARARRVFSPAAFF